MSEFVKVTEPVTGVSVTVPAGSVQARLWAVAEPEQQSKESEDAAPAGNASRDAWAEYAEGLGIDVPEDAKRDDIKALVDEQD